MSTILVIEDERMTRNSLLSFLEQEGYSTLAAENGLVGVNLAQEYLPDLIICDIMMPELDGYDVLTTLQQQPATATIPFIFLTMAATEEGLRQSLEMGADDYLRKPVTSEELRRAIAAQLARTHPAVSAQAPGLGSGASLPIPPLDPQANPTRSIQATAVNDPKLQLSERLCQVVLQRLSTMRYQVERLQEFTVQPEHSQLAHDLQAEFSQLLAIVNEAITLQKVLTPENAASLLAQFSWTQQDTP